MAMASTAPRLLHLPAQDGGDRLVITALKTHVLVVRSYATHAALGPSPSQWHLQLTCRVLHEESKILRPRTQQWLDTRRGTQFEPPV